MNSKIIPIIFLIIILGVGSVAFKFYSDKESLATENKTLKGEKKNLVEENSSLKYKYSNLEKASKEIKKKITVINEELSRVEDEKDTWKTKWAEASKQRDLLQEKLTKAPMELKVAEGRPPEAISEEHWADFVKEKAALQVKLDTLSKILIEEKSMVLKFDKEKKELSIEIDQLTKENSRLAEGSKFKERTMRVMSMDLVSEREERAAAVKELRKLRSENVSLKRELVFSNKEQVRAQDRLKKALIRKEELEGKIANAESIVRDKSLAFEELQKQLVKTMDSSRDVITDSASVELPPIVVKPGTPGLRGLRGEVISVVRDENFVVVDIGESSGLRPGALLRILRGDREIGTVEVVETRKEISAANIEQIIGGATIQEGDICVTR